MRLWMCRPGAVLLAVCAAGFFAPSAGAQSDIAVTPADNLSTRINTANAGDTIVFQEAGIYTLTQPLLINQNISFRGAVRPGHENYKIILTGLPAPAMIIVDNTAQVKFENLTLQVSGTGILVRPGARVTLNQCYVHGGNDGVLVNGGTAIVANSAFARINTAIRVTQGDAFVGQSTFSEGTGQQLRLEEGSITAVACLFSAPPGGNFGAVSALANSFRALGNIVLPGNGNFSGILDATSVLLPTPTNLPEFDTAAPWTGKLRTQAPAVSGVFSYPAQLVPFRGTDFEGDIRQTGLFAGADETPISGPQQWLTTVVDPPVLGRGKQATIEIVLSLPGSVVFPGEGSATIGEVLIVPQLGSATPQGALRASDARVVAESENSQTIRATFTPTNTFMNGLLVDGIATVYLNIGGALYGEGINATGFMTNAAIEGSRFTVDTIPPRLDTSAGVNALSFIENANDNLPGQAVGASNWAGNATQPVSFGTVLGGTQAPQVFFNGPGVVGTGLSFDFVATFIDEGPRGTDGVLLGADASGFDTFSPIPPGPSAAVLAGSADQPAAPRWVTASTAVVNGPVSAAFNTVGNEITARWTFNEPETVLGNAESSYRWVITANVVAQDRAGNQSDPLSNPVEIWWMNPESARAKLTNSGFRGTQSTEPVFTWELDRLGGRTPQNAEPCTPIARFKIYAADDPTNIDGQWTAVGPWSDWTSAKTFSGRELTEAIARVRGTQLLIVVEGADESGNAQVSGIPDAITLEDLIVAGLPFDYWFNPGPPPPINTTIRPEYWYDRVSGVAAGSVGAIDPGERTFGASARVPIAPADSCTSQRLEAAFTVSVDIPNFNPDDDVFVNYELFEDGRKVAAGVLTDDDRDPSRPTPVFRLPVVRSLLSNRSGDVIQPFLNFPPSDCGCGNVIADRLGDDGTADASGGCDDSRTPRRARNVEYVFTAQGVRNAATGATVDTTPASTRFTVVVDRGTADEQPVRAFSRL